MPLFLLTFIVLAFGDIQYNTVVESIESPDGTYLAVVTDSDQGAMGGNTYVDVYDQKRSVDFYVVKFSKPYSRVYQGDWGEYKYMEIEWKDKNTLMINGESYLID